MIVVECAVCFKIVGEYENQKAVPKSVVCPHCNIAQRTQTSKAIGYSRKRNYPQGFWENQ